MSSEVWANGDLIVTKYAGPARDDGKPRSRFQFTLPASCDFRDPERGYISLDNDELRDLIHSLNGALVVPAPEGLASDRT